MKQIAGWVALVCVAVLSSWNILAQAPVTGEECKPIAQALEATKKLKPGMLRAELEKEFEEDGGISFFEKDSEASFRQKGRYVYRKCPYIKIDVELIFEGTTEAPAPSQKDRIRSISRPYLEYPYAD